MLLGIFGVAAVMHRHWPLTTKTLATATLVGGATVIILRCIVANIGAGDMFGPQAFVIFLPLLLFWSGAWIRRSHHPLSWTLAGCLMLFSVLVGLIGATDPYPRNGYDGYSVAQALNNLVHADSLERGPVLAGR